MPRRACLTPVLAVLVLAGCGVPGSAADRDKALADTCLSTIIRAGLPAPTPQQIAPVRFAEERQRLIATGRRFNTVTPYKNVCTKIKDELQAQLRSGQKAQTAGSSDVGADGGADAQESSAADTSGP